MILEFVSGDQSTLWDIVYNTYGSADFIVKLMEDNNFLNINTYPAVGQVFLWDDTLIVDQNVQIRGFPSSTRKYATRGRFNTNDANMKYYEQNLEDQYTASADGETVIVRPALIGNRIVQIEREIRPLGVSDFLFNPSTGTISLQGGLTLDAGQTIFIIYATIITS